MIGDSGERRPRAADRVALALYPPWFRRRYGDELADALRHAPRSARTTADLVVGAAKAWTPALRRAHLHGRRLAPAPWIDWLATGGLFAQMVGIVVCTAILMGPTGRETWLSGVETVVSVIWITGCTVAAAVSTARCLPALVVAPPP